MTLFRRCGHGYLSALISFCKVVHSFNLLEAAALLKTCAHTPGWNDPKISVNSKIIAKFAIKLMIIIFYSA